MTLAVLCITLGIQDAFAVTIRGRAPQFTNGGDPDDSGSLNHAINSAFMTALGMANDAVAQYKDQEKLAQAFCDANAYASHAVEFWGYQGYDKIAFLGGLSLAIEMPSLESGSLADALEEIEETGDAQIGASLGGGLNLGLHLGWFNTKARDWYVNLKVFKYDLSIPYKGYTFNYKNLTIGLGANYQLVRQKKFGKNLFLWRGISIGTGFLFQQSSMDYGIDIQTQSSSFTWDTTAMSVILDSRIMLKLTMNTYTIPIDVTTSLRILYFLNINLGAGIDFNFGNAQVFAQARAHAHVTGDPGVEYGIVVPGFVQGYAFTDGVPFMLRGRLMAGMGITIGPAVLCDFNLTYYFDTGIAMNLSAGFAW